MLTPDLGLVADATEKKNSGNNTKNYGWNNDHDDDCDDDHRFGFGHNDDCDDDDHDDDHDDDCDNNHNRFGFGHDDDCDDDDHDDGGVTVVPPTIKVYKVVLNHQGTIPSVASFGVTLNNTQVTTNGTLFTVAQDKPVTLDESGLVGYEFVEIRGDGHCPENLGGTITLDNDQHIECYIVNQPAGSSGPIEPGVIFHYNTLTFSVADRTFGDSCSAAGKTPPCVELANVDETNGVLVVDEELKTDTTIILFSVIEADKVSQTPPQFATSPLCVLSGVGPHTSSYARNPEESPVVNPSGILGFEVNCSQIEADMFKVSYALIETERQP
jgi:hypothetical protein